MVELLLHEQYVEHAEDPDQATRREELGQIARAVVAAIQDREWSVADMARELGAAARGRHILAWSNRPDEQDAWRSAGVDGAVDADSVLVGILNRGGNKLDRFLEVDATLDVGEAPPAGPGGDEQGPGEVVLRVTLRNTVPPASRSTWPGPRATAVWPRASTAASWRSRCRAPSPGPRCRGLRDLRRHRAGRPVLRGGPRGAAGAGRVDHARGPLHRCPGPCVGCGSSRRPGCRRCRGASGATAGPIAEAHNVEW